MQFRQGFQREFLILVLLSKMYSNLASLAFLRSPNISARSGLPGLKLKLWTRRLTLAYAFLLSSGQAVPLEYNMDGLQAISFTKGCYVGQELIARAHFKGVIRKRVMPITLPSSSGSYSCSLPVSLSNLLWYLGPAYQLGCRIILLFDSLG